MDDVWRWWTAIVALALCFLALWFTPSLFHLQGANAAVLRGVIGLIGATGMSAFVWNQVRRKGARPESGPNPGRQEPPQSAEYLIREVPDLLAAAYKRLQALTGRRSSVQTFPLLVLLGGKDSGKTFLLRNSELSLEWLAGQDLKPAEATPTPVLNVQLSGNLLIVDAGSPVVADERVWHKLTGWLCRPGVRLLFGLETLPTRGLLVCVNCDLLTGTPELLASTAALLRKRLEEFALQSGSRVSVYVVFTKADKLKHFIDFFQQLDLEGSAEFLGAQLDSAAQAGSDEGAYRERLAASFSQIVSVLRSKRPDYLRREHDLETRRRAYEFPRTFSKFNSTVVDFLNRMCPVSNLDRKPYLRGFFFAGTRLWISGAGFENTMTGSANASRVFRPGEITPHGLSGLGNARPQQMFVADMFRNIIVPDLTQRKDRANATVARYRRLAAALLLLLLAVWGAGFSRSHVLNEKNASDLKNLSVAHGLPALAELRGKIIDLEASSQAPFFYREHWGLFIGNALLPTAREIYVEHFKAELLRPLRDGLVKKLSMLPRDPAPGSWQPTYENLKVYLVITSHNDKSSPEMAPFATGFLAGLQNWTEQQKTLATREFKYYLEVLRADPGLLTSFVPGELVKRTQDYLDAFSATQQVYGIAAAATVNVPGLKFKDETISTRTDVPGLFTNEGKSVFAGALGKSSQMMQGEAWVLGPNRQISAGSQADAESLYNSNTVRQWKEFLMGINVREFGRNPRLAATRIESLADRNRALFRILCLIAKDTSGNAAFLSVAQACNGAEINASRQSYVNALVGLQTAVARFAATADGTSDRESASGACMTAVDGLRREAATFANGLTGPDGTVNEQLRKLFFAPAVYTEPICTVKPGAALNAAGQRFCQQYQLIISKFPFSPDSPLDVTAGELSALFDPHTGELAKLGSEVSKNASGVRMTPQFRSFYDRMQRLGAALYNESSVPSLSFSLRPLFTPDWAKGYILLIQGQHVNESTGAVTLKLPESVSEASQLRRSTQEAVTGSYSGPWGGLRLLEHAVMKQISASTFRAEFVGQRLEGGPSSTSPIIFELTIPPGSQPFLAPGYFHSLRSCNSQVAE